MGVRFRKSINLGGGFRVNLSKSGVGYSFGGKGFRVTKTSKGKTRTTASIPGTGLSYTKEYGSKNKKSSGTGVAQARNNCSNNSDNRNNNYYDTVEIKNVNAKNLVSAGLEEMLAAATKARKLNKLFFICLCVFFGIGVAQPLFLIGAIIFAVLFLLVRKKGIIALEYSFEDDEEARVSKQMEPFVNILKSKKIWWITQTSKVIDKKYASGASNSIKRKDCRTSKKPPFPFRTNATTVYIKSGRESLLFLPDKVLVIQGSKVGAVNYTDLSMSFHGQRFIETEGVPRDANVVDYTWKYVNKSGEPDKRFQDNPKLPICLYGELEIRSELGINTDILYSRYNSN